MRSPERGSPENARTESTACSSVRGPARSPSFVTCPTSSTANPSRLARPTSASAHARTWATPPADARDVLGAERSGSNRPRAGAGPFGRGRGQHAARGRAPARSRSAVARQPQAAGPRRRPAPRTPRRRPPGGVARPGQPGDRLQDQGRLADARLAGQQHHRAGHQPAAQDPIEPREAGRQARVVGIGGVPKRGTTSASPAGHARAPRSSPTPRTPGIARTTARPDGRNPRTRGASAPWPRGNGTERD